MFNFSKGLTQGFNILNKVEWFMECNIINWGYMKSLLKNVFL